MNLLLYMIRGIPKSYIDLEFHCLKLETIELENLLRLTQKRACSFVLP